jgi:hypothetical protein
MNIAAHTASPEEIMAFLDGELSHTEAQAVSVHLDRCAECAGLAEQLRATSRSLSQWTVPPAPSSLDASVNNLVAKLASHRKAATPDTYTHVSPRNWRFWAIGGGGALAMVLILVAIAVSIRDYEDRSNPQMAMQVQRPEVQSYVSPAKSMPLTAQQSRLPSASAGAAGMNDSMASPPPPLPLRRAKAQIGLATGLEDRAATSAASAPMIARTVSLTIVVKDIAAARASLDTILAQHRGYSAQLTVLTPENLPSSVQASLRIPAPELASAVGQLKALGRVQNETQSGEEVSQQHADLVARLQNSRETEARLRAILQQRTGKIEDVLQVEEEIARVRGEIEQMEAGQKALEHRVDFASVDLQLTQEYKASFSSPAASASTRIGNAFVAGCRHASETLLGIVLFLEEYGPVLLIWLVILGLPAILIRRRYRKTHSSI